jgi:hemerythrin
MVNSTMMTSYTPSWNSNKPKPVFLLLRIRLSCSAKDCHCQLCRNILKHPKPNEDIKSYQSILEETQKAKRRWEMLNNLRTSTDATNEISTCWNELIRAEIWQQMMKHNKREQNTMTHCEISGNLARYREISEIVPKTVNRSWSTLENPEKYWEILKMLKSAEKC